MNKYALWIAYYALMSKEIRRYLRIWPQTIISPLITTSLYFLIFGHFVGRNINVQSLGTNSYMAYIVPGMLMMQIIMISYINTSSTIFSAIYSKSIEEIVVSPMPNQLILLAYTSASVLRAIVTCILISIVALVFINLHIKHILIMLIVAISTAILFSTLGMINGLYAKKFDDINMIPTFILTPLTYLGGVFYSVHSLPVIWQHISLFNPIVYTVNAFRYSMIGISNFNIIISLSFLIGFTAIVYIICGILLAKTAALRN